MRMWHKSLIDVLPDKQLIAQWRELCAIVGSIKKNGTPNHLLVNKVMWYNKSHFYNYCCLICNEMFNRGFEPTDESRNKILEYVSDEERQVGSSISIVELYQSWMNDRYLLQCFYNLQEKFDCGGIDSIDWKRIVEKVKQQGFEWEIKL
jgi:uncharacterized protein (TIGR02328 family)